MAAIRTSSHSQVNALDAFTVNALKYIEVYDNEKEWARAFSRHYFHTVDNMPGFLPIYTHLLSAANSASTAARAGGGNIPPCPVAPVAAPVVNQKSKSPTKPKKPTKSFERNFQAMAEDAYKNLNHFDSPESWARATARAFYHEYECKTSFLPIYKALLEYNEMMEENDEHVQPKASDKMQDALNKFNKIMLREYNRWWDAFVEEADEQDDGESFSPQKRFALHMSRIFKQKTDLPIEKLMPVMEAWLLEHHKEA